MKDDEFIKMCKEDHIKMLKETIFLSDIFIEKCKKRIIELEQELKELK